MAIPTCFLSPAYFSIPLISRKASGRKKPLLEQLKWEGALCHDGTYILGMQGATPSVPLRPRAAHLQLWQRRCRTARVRESSRKGEELCQPEAREMLHRTRQGWKDSHPAGGAAVAAAAQLERDAGRGAVARLMETGLCAALALHSPALSQDCSLSSAPVICWIQSLRAVQEQKLCSMTLQKVVPGGRGPSSHYPHKTK